MKRPGGMAHRARRLGRVIAAGVLLSAIFAGAPAEARKYPKIFGSIELFSTKTQRFPKWTGMLDRFQDGNKACESSTCTMKGWKEFIAELQGKDEEFTRKILEGMEKVIQEFGRKNGYTFIFVKNEAMLFVDEKADVTEEVLKLFNTNRKK